VACHPGIAVEFVSARIDPAENGFEIPILIRVNMGVLLGGALGEYGRKFG
jgi:hypothetical protein